MNAERLIDINKFESVVCRECLRTLKPRDFFDINFHRRNCDLVLGLVGTNRQKVANQKK
ncbi:hypothetical protein [Acinetobacter gerneri]|uniref:hypothetical protein n=1 Tax=Acinetobacter gerneri TaxID=202952 RepID=UPI003214FB70